MDYAASLEALLVPREHPEGRIVLLRLPPPVRASLATACATVLGLDLWKNAALPGVFDLSLPWVREAVKIVLATCPESWIPNPKRAGRPLDPLGGLSWSCFPVRWASLPGSPFWVAPEGPAEWTWELADCQGDSRTTTRLVSHAPLLAAVKGREPNREEYAAQAVFCLRCALLELCPPTE